MKFSDLRRRTAPHQGALLSALSSVLSSGRFILGAEVEAFERAWAAYCGAPYAIGVANGTEAIAFALRAAGVDPGARVAVPAATSVATWHAIVSAGAIPVPVDVDDDGLIDVACLAAKNGSISAVVPVHLYGRMSDLAAVHAVAENKGLKVVTDAAQGHGLPVIGTTAFSFYPTKNLGGLGDGGAVVTNSAAVDAFVRERRSLGGAGAVNSRLDEMQAACLSARLPHLDAENDRRRVIARQYDAGLAECGVRRPRIGTEFNVWHQYVIRHPRRDALRAELLHRGIETGCHYPVTPAETYGHDPARYPKARALFAECLSLPIGSEVTDEDVAYVIEQVRACA